MNLKTKLIRLISLVGGALRAAPEEVHVETNLTHSGLVFVAKITTSTARAVIAVDEDEPSVIVIRTPYAYLYVEGGRYKLDLSEMPRTKEEAKDIAFPLFVLVGDSSFALDERSKENYEAFQQHWNSL